MTSYKITATKAGQVRRLHNNGQTSRKIYKNTVLWQETC